ncbi:permease-like cell division protein FtsX [Asanoa sp. NPDC049573]|uniref:permease-like cell division protein FtsX n=1 Tax=Asanoa sp. NPDC049573 TaxID=3155396 RepID=UPI00342CBA86
MSQPVPDPEPTSAGLPPATDGPSGDAAPTSVATAGPEPRRPRSVAKIVVAAFGLAALVGLTFVAGFGTGFAVGRPAESSYEIRVFLERDATEAQKAAVRTALERLDLTGEVRFKTREEAAADAQEKFKDYPDVLDSMTADNLPETFEATITTREPSCAGISPIAGLGGVDEMFVVRPATDDRPGVRLGC